MTPADHDHVPLPAISALIQPAPIDALLTRFIEDPEERAFVARCILDAGPAHHRGANYVILRLLAQALERLEETAAPKEGPESAEQTVQIPMRLPAPHVISTDQTYPLRMEISALQKLAEGDERRLASMIDCLLDGPPQHALANALMVNALGRLLERLEALRK
jgi:hypothetical protein